MKNSQELGLLLRLLPLVLLQACIKPGAEVPNVSASQGAAAKSGGTSGGAVPPPNSTFTLPDPGAPYVPPTNLVAVPNTMVIENKTGADQVDYPVQIGRAFVSGEIANFPQIIANASPLPTQADVKQRYADGSVKFAVISFILPTLPANASVAIAFRNQTSGNNTPITQAQMLASQFNFDAVIRLTNGAASVSSSARDMLQAGKFEYWTSGPIATTIVLSDHSVQRQFDMGFDSLRSFRPIVYATFWPTLNKVRVRFVGENGSLQFMQDFRYDLSLTTDFSSPRQTYSQANIPHAFGSRWTKVFWIGGEPDRRVNINHNLAYIAKTKFLPNYDTTTPFPEEVTQAVYSAYQASPRMLYQNSYWTVSMPTTGGRMEIAPSPGMYMPWLYTGDWRGREVALGLADLAAAWRWNLRESDPSLKFDRNQTVPAIGRPVSLAARPDFWFPTNNGVYGAPRPQVATFPENQYPWIAETAHVPDPFSVPYILTGEHFYLESLQNWVFSSALVYAPGLYGRGLSGRAGLQDQVRGNAWTMRNRANAAYLAVDGSAEATLLRQYVDDFIALWEGAFNIRGTTFESDPQWVWARANLNYSSLSPLGFWYRPAVNFVAEGQWQDYFLIFSLGMLKEKGFKTDRLFSHIAKVINTQFIDPGWDPKLIMCYYTPVAPLGNPAYFQSWTEVRNYIESSNWADCNIANTIASFQPSSYAIYAVAAAAMAASEPGGAIAWPWVDNLVRKKMDLLSSDSWSFRIVPR